MRNSSELGGVVCSAHSLVSINLALSSLASVCVSAMLLGRAVHECSCSAVMACVACISLQTQCVNSHSQLETKPQTSQPPNKSHTTHFTRIQSPQTDRYTRFIKSSLNTRTRTSRPAGPIRPCSHHARPHHTGSARVPLSSTALFAGRLALSTTTTASPILTLFLIFLIIILCIFFCFDFSERGEGQREGEGEWGESERGRAAAAAAAEGCG